MTTTKLDRDESKVRYWHCAGCSEKFTSEQASKSHTAADGHCRNPATVPSLERRPDGKRWGWIDVPEPVYPEDSNSDEPCPDLGEAIYYPPTPAPRYRDQPDAPQPKPRRAYKPRARVSAPEARDATTRAASRYFHAQLDAKRTEAEHRAGMHSRCDDTCKGASK